MTEPAHDDFTMLRYIANVERIFGFLLVIAGFFLIMRTISESWDMKERWIESIGTLMVGIVTYGFGELITLFLQIEKNTRH